MRLFLDANVLFTAMHNPTGKAALVIELGDLGHWELYSSLYALEEARRNLERKFPQSLDTLHARLCGVRFVERQADCECPSELRQKDRPIFQAARSCRATHLLTGDMKDFGSLMNRPGDTFGIRIQTVGEFLSYVITIA